jgi:hypothetical protein
MSASRPSRPARTPRVRLRRLDGGALEARRSGPPGGPGSPLLTLLRRLLILSIWLLALPGSTAIAEALGDSDAVARTRTGESASDDVDRRADIAGDIYYVRSDGGDARRCNGRLDAPAPAAGRDQDCAWRHPFIALPPGGAPRIRGGDALFIRPGDYRMGYGADDARCSTDFPWDCYMAALPSGPSIDQPTRLSGVDAFGVCRDKPELWGAERAARVLNLEGSSNIVVECLTITDRAACVEGHCHGGDCREVARCPRERYPFGDWAGTGVYAADSANVQIIDVDVHGLANRGFHAGRLRDWRLTRVRIIGNGWAGWDGDLGSGGSSNAGTLHFRQVEIAWNGCVEGWPDRRPFGCWAQSTGGYGDGLGTAATAGHWILEDSEIHHNTSDGLDLLYIESPGRLTARRLRAHANAGNQVKASGATVIEDSEIDGTCAAFRGVGNMAESDLCRALGGAVAVQLHPGIRAELAGNRIRGNGDCLVVAGGGDASSHLKLRSNHLSGRTMWNNHHRRSCGFYAHETDAAVAFDGNTFLGVRNRQCPRGSVCGAAEDG